MYKLIIIFIISFISLDSFGQRNYELMIMDDSVNFYDVCRVADQYFQINDKNTKGIYLLEIETNDGIINKKLILQ
tara:strand:+ start:329 stop:553 length:225 start_codon:yes stop_codon:yes gene_type:complete